MNGTYTNPHPGQGTVIDISRSGTAHAWITYRAAPGHHPKLKFDSWNGIYVGKSASYIAITGFQVEGSLGDRSLDFCTAQEAQSSPDPVCNGNGISIDSRDQQTNKSHHIVVSYNTVHDCAGGGISAIESDYISIDKNVVYNTSWHTRYASSAVSILTPWNFDSSTDYRNYVRGNRTHNNKTLVKWEQIDKLSDGNGIILDTFGSQNHLGVYGGRTLVNNNVTFSNGGSGIHSYASVHVDIVNNSAYQNGLVVGYANIYAADSNDVNILNNAVYAQAGGKVNSNYGNSNVTYDYNVYFGGVTPDVQGAHDRVVDPQFVDPGNGDLRILQTSPTIDSGTSRLAPTIDIRGTPRPQGAATDVGAYEYKSAQ